MTDPIRIVLAGVPVAKGRARMTRAGFAYTPAHTRKSEAALRLAASEAMGDREPLSCAVRVTIAVFLPIPISWSAKKRLSAAQGYLVPTSRPDLDNYVKAAFDACNTIVFRDDSQVAGLDVLKCYDAKPRIEILVEECGGIIKAINP